MTDMTKIQEKILMEVLKPKSKGGEQYDVWYDNPKLLDEYNKKLDLLGIVVDEYDNSFNRVYNNLPPPKFQEELIMEILKPTSKGGKQYDVWYDNPRLLNEYNEKLERLGICPPKYDNLAPPKQLEMVEKDDCISECSENKIPNNTETPSDIAEPKNIGTNTEPELIESGDKSKCKTTEKTAEYAILQYEKHLKAMRKYRSNNKEHIATYKRGYYEKNKDELREKNKEYQRNYWINNPEKLEAKLEKQLDKRSSKITTEQYDAKIEKVKQDMISLSSKLKTLQSNKQRAITYVNNNQVVSVE